MKSTGVRKNTDATYRITIPPEVREKLNIKMGDTFEFYTKGKDQIVLKKIDKN